MTYNLKTLDDSVYQGSKDAVQLMNDVFFNKGINGVKYSMKLYLKEGRSGDKMYFSFDSPSELAARVSSFRSFDFDPKNRDIEKKNFAKAILFKLRDARIISSDVLAILK
jgi:hypothetical protein